MQIQMQSTIDIDESLDSNKFQTRFKHAKFSIDN